jgi:hypothetical protein
VVSKRMIQILGLLNQEYHDYTLKEKMELGRKLKEFNYIATMLAANLGTLKERDPEKLKERLEVSYKDVDNEIKLRNSISLKRIILTCEGLHDRYNGFFGREQHGNAVKDDKEYYANPYYNPSFRSYLSYRFEVSLVEVIAGKLFPKGRSWKNHTYSKHFDGYEEAFKKAKSLQASYSRTLNTLVDKGLVEKFQRDHNKRAISYVITAKGRERLAILTTNRIDNN